MRPAARDGVELEATEDGRRDELTCDSVIAELSGRVDSPAVCGVVVRDGTVVLSSGADLKPRDVARHPGRRGRAGRHAGRIDECRGPPTKDGKIRCGTAEVGTSATQRAQTYATLDQSRHRSGG